MTTTTTTAAPELPETTPASNLFELRLRPDAERISYTSADDGMFCTLRLTLHASRDAVLAVCAGSAAHHALVKEPRPFVYVTDTAYQRGLNLTAEMNAGRAAGDTTVYVFTVRCGSLLHTHAVTGSSVTDEPYPPGGTLRVIRGADGTLRAGPLDRELVTWFAAPIPA